MLMCFCVLEESAESSAAPAMDVLTFIQQPVERIQTYQALLKVRTIFIWQCNLIHCYEIIIVFFSVQIVLILM